MNNLSYIPQFVSVSDLQRNYPALLKTLKMTKKPLLVLKKNDLEAVILTPDFYQSMMEKIQTLLNPISYRNTTGVFRMATSSLIATIAVGDAPDLRISPMTL